MPKETQLDPVSGASAEAFSRTVGLEDGYKTYKAARRDGYGQGLSIFVGVFEGSIQAMAPISKNFSDQNLSRQAIGQYLRSLVAEMSLNTGLLFLGMNGHEPQIAIGLKVVYNSAAPYIPNVLRSIVRHLPFIPPAF